jgi:chromosomal replication initiator protein
LLRPRFAFCALAKEFTSLSYPQIGMMLGNRDHTTILHAVRRAALIYAHDGEFMAQVDECRRRLRVSQ